jgi:5'-nucleotidase
MIRILHTNDMHGTLSSSNSHALIAQLQALRSESDLYFDSGDCIKAGNLAIPIKEDPVWNVFEDLHLTASVIGNRETHPLLSAFDMKIKGAKHPILVANVIHPDGKPVFVQSMIIEQNRLKIGLFGVMVPMATDNMKTAFAWSYRWTSPIPTAIEIARELRPKCDLVIALTHIGNREDQKLAESTTDIDIIFGGHSHTVIPNPVKVNQTYIAQGGSHNRYAGVYAWENGILSGELKTLTR